MLLSSPRGLGGWVGLSVCPRRDLRLFHHREMVAGPSGRLRLLCAGVGASRPLLIFLF